MFFKHNKILAFLNGKFKADAFFPQVISRPGQSQGLIYKHRRDSLIK